MAIASHRVLHLVINFLAGEWMLRRLNNGGTLVLLRSLWVASFLFVIALGIYEATRPTASWNLDLAQLSLLIHEKVTWLGAIFAATYAALYARFASQWTYLAGLYNQIKAASVGSDDKSGEVLSSWKAAFVEDAETLHLAGKPLFASVIRGMLQDECVREMYCKYTPGGKARFEKVRDIVDKTCLRESVKHGPASCEKAEDV